MIPNTQNQITYKAANDTVSQQTVQQPPQGKQNFNAKNPISNNQVLKTVAKSDVSVFSFALTGILWFALSKLHKYVIPNLTKSSATGAKLLPFMEAALLAQTVKKTAEAPKDEKISTGSENVANGLGLLLSIPLTDKISKIIGNLKYIGTGNAKDSASRKDAINKIRQMISDLNTKVGEGTISRMDYTTQKAEIKKLLKGDSNLLQRPFKFIGKIFSAGNECETIKPFIDKSKSGIGTSISNKIKSLFSKVTGQGTKTLRRVAGVVIIGSILAKIATTVSHKIFGKPTNSVTDDINKAHIPPAGENTALGMSQEEFVQKLEKHPDVLQKMETDPVFLNQMLTNPQVFAQILNDEIKLSDVVTQDPRIKNSKYIVQPANTNTAKKKNTIPYLDIPDNYKKTKPAAAAQNQAPAQTPVQTTPMQKPAPNQSVQYSPAQDESQSKMDLFGLGKKKKEEPKENKEETQIQTDTNEPVRTYIPSSKPAAGITKAEANALDPTVAEAINKADAAEAQALKSLGM